MGRAKFQRTEVEEMGEEIRIALSFLFKKAMEGGVKEPGEAMTMIIPHLLMGPSEEEAVEFGDWQIRIERIA